MNCYSVLWVYMPLERQNLKLEGRRRKNMKCFVLHKVLECYFRFFVFVFVLHLNMLDWVCFFWCICQSYRNSHVLVCLLFFSKVALSWWSVILLQLPLQLVSVWVWNTFDFFIALKMSFLVGLKKQIVLLILLYSFFRLHSQLIYMNTFPWAVQCLLLTNSFRRILKVHFLVLNCKHPCE